MDSLGSLMVIYFALIIIIGVCTRAFGCLCAAIRVRA